MVFFNFLRSGTLIDSTAEQFSTSPYFYGIPSHFTRVQFFVHGCCVRLCVLEGCVHHGFFSNSAFPTKRAQTDICLGSALLSINAREQKISAGRKRQMIRFLIYQ